MANTRPQNLKTIFTLTAEAAYGTFVLDGSINKLYDTSEAAMAEVVEEHTSDADLIKGNEFPRDTGFNVQLSRDITLPLSFWATAEVCGLIMTNAMGATSTTGSGPYTHIITAQNGLTSDQLPSVSLVQLVQGDTGTYWKYIGCIPNEYRLSADKKGRSELSTTFFTDGSLTAVPSHTVPAPQTQTPLFGKNATFGYADAGSSVVDASATLRSWEFTWNNNLSREDARGQIAKNSGGLFLEELRWGDARSAELTVTVQGDKAHALWAKWIAHTAQNIEISIVNGTSSVKIAMPRCYITAAKDGFDGIRNTIEYTITPLSTTTTSVTPVTITVVNGVAAYLV